MLPPSKPRDSLTPRVPTSEPTLENLPVVATELAIAEYLEDCRCRGLADSTVTGYAWALQRLRALCPCLPADRRQIRSILGDAALGQESRRDLRRALNTFFGWAKREYGYANPLDDLPRPPRRKTLPRILRDDEVLALWEAALWQRDRALVVLPIDTGLRVGEITNLRWRDVGPGYLVVPVEGKTGSRRVPLSPNVRELLDGLGDDEHIWVGKMGPLGLRGIQQVYKRLYRRAGIARRKNGAHTLRHAFATNYLRSGGQLVALQKILGHQSIETTMIYVHLAGTDVDADHAIHSPIHRLGLTEIIKPVPVVIPRMIQPKLF